MRFIIRLILAALALATFSSAAIIAQNTDGYKLHLTGGRVMQVEDAWEDDQGFWYRQGGITQQLDRAKVKRVEQIVTEVKEKTPADVSVTAARSAASAPSSYRLHLVGGPLVEADEVAEEPGGAWVKRGNMSVFYERSRIERIERVESVSSISAAAPESSSSNGPSNRSDSWNISSGAAKVESFFQAKFGHPLPVTAFRQSALHTRWGFDHRNSMDVGLHPDSREGRALREFLTASGIPFLYFRGPVPGAASGPHIHIGWPSRRLVITTSSRTSRGGRKLAR